MGMASQMYFPSGLPCFALLVREGPGGQVKAYSWCEATRAAKVMGGDRVCSIEGSRQLCCLTVP